MCKHLPCQLKSKQIQQAEQLVTTQPSREELYLNLRRKLKSATAKNTRKSPRKREEAHSKLVKVEAQALIIKGEESSCSLIESGVRRVATLCQSVSVLFTEFPESLGEVRRTASAAGRTELQSEAAWSSVPRANKPSDQPCVT